MIIVDTNVILAFLLTSGITRRIILGHKDLFIAPEHCFKELWKHRARWNKHNLSDTELSEIIDIVKKYFIFPVEEEVYKGFLAEATKLIEDINDAPVLALALSVENEGVWTYNVKHFDIEKVKARVKVLTTKDVLKMHPLEE